MYGCLIKRALDVIISMIALTFAAPIIGLGWLAIRLTSRGPGFFFQTRVGRGQRPFRIWKLRTMSVNPSRELKQTRAGDPDVLLVGRVLRRLKIDELPQIVNVLIGDMSVVGPRPCMQVTVDEMPEWAKRRFEVRPGVTGLAQVNGNVTLSWPERWRYDIAYVDKCSFRSDLAILLKTIPVVVFGEEVGGKLN